MPRTLALALILLALCTAVLCDPCWGTGQGFVCLEHNADKFVMCDTTVSPHARLENCSTGTLCSATPRVPTKVVPCGVPTPPTLNVTELCMRTGPGYLCLAANSSQLVHCDLAHGVAHVAQCPAGTVCVATPMRTVAAMPCGTPLPPLSVNTTALCASLAGEGFFCLAPNATEYLACSEARGAVVSRCAHGTVCSARPLVPTEFVPCSFVEPPVQPRNLTWLCRNATPGFMCLAANSSQYLHCGEEGAELVNCSTGTLCNVEPGVATSRMPCRPATVPQNVSANVMTLCGGVQRGFFCPGRGTARFVRCDAQHAVAMVDECPPDTVCNATPGFPASFVPCSIPPPVPDEVDLAQLCAGVVNGFVCLAANASRYVRCSSLTDVHVLMPCAPGTVCVATPLVPTIHNPCGYAHAPPPVKVWDMCAQVRRGFFCAEANATRYLRCDADEHVVSLVPCPEGTRCRATPAVPSASVPCGHA